LLAVMEIRPLSKGHVLIIPKVEVLRKEDLPSGVVSCAKDIAEKIRTNLGAKKVKVAIEQKFGEIVVEVVPEYDVPVPEADRKEADKDELLKLRDEIVKEVIKVETKKEIIKQSNKEEKKSEVLKLSRRIP